MNNSGYIVLLDPAIEDHDGTESSNLGDLIISRYVNRYLHELFPGKEIIKISSKAYLSSKQQRFINNAFFTFVGGTNVLHYNMLHYRKLMLRAGKLLWLFPGIKNLILFGCGWGPESNKKINFKSRVLFKKILHPGFIHSCRDQISASKLNEECGINSINTACPTMWTLHGKETNLSNKPEDCLFTLTDYATDPERDSSIIAVLLNQFKTLHFFPQGKNDLAYLSHLNIYTANKPRFRILPHHIEDFFAFTANTDFVYAGTRLHCGTYCLSENKASIIAGIDNRSVDIAKDTFLPVFTKDRLDLLSDWLDGKKVFGKQISLPLSAIKNWKKQFSAL